MASWYPGDPGNSIEAPSYPTVPDIEVLDAVRPALSGRERRMWTRARNVALDAWTPSGLSFPTSPGTGRFNAGAITLSLDPGLVYGGLGGFTSLYQAGFVLIQTAYLQRTLDKRMRRHLRWLIGHEFGHALGFDHGGDGIMGAGADTPDAEELLVAHNYYLGA